MHLGSMSHILHTTYYCLGQCRMSGRDPYNEAALLDQSHSLISFCGKTKCCNTVAQSSTFRGSHSADAVESQLLRHRLREHGV